MIPLEDFMVFGKRRNNRKQKELQLKLETAKRRKYNKVARKQRRINNLNRK